ncbi:MAG: pyridoxal-phosphate dependent enzyme [Alphaproteobacteria bacterium]
MMEELALADLETAAGRVARRMAPTPQIAWPGLSTRAECEVWVKHEALNPAGTYKLRGALNYVGLLRERRPCMRTVVTATPDGDCDHGYAVALAARLAGMSPKVVVPVGTAPEQLAALRALGPTVEGIEAGANAAATTEEALVLAATRNYHVVPPFHRWLVQGAATGGLEMLRAVADLEAVFVPLGAGVGLCGMIAARDALGLGTRIIGVVPEHRPDYALSFRAGRNVSASPSADIDEAALEKILDGAADVVTVTKEKTLAAMGYYLRDTHSLADPAAAAALAALLERKDDFAGKRVGVVLSGSRVDAETLRSVVVMTLPACGPVSSATARSARRP